MFKITFKPEIDKADLEDLHHWVHAMFAEFCHYAMIRDLPVVVTSIYSDRINSDIQSVSSTHQTHRALDISARGWSHSECVTAEQYLNMKFKDTGAITSRGVNAGKPRACVYHDSGYGDHFHLQCRYE